MNILALETSSSSGSVAVARDGKLTAMSYLDIRLTHSERLLPQVDWSLQQSDLTVADLDAIAVSNGPGSFTGLRIGLAAAKGLCLARSIPLIPLSTAAIVAYGLYGSDRDILVLLDAKMNELHAAFYTPFGEEISPIRCVRIGDLLAGMRRPAVVAGEGFLRYRKDIEASGVDWRPALPHQHHPSASVMIDLALACKPNPVFDFAEIAALEPYYLRKSQAEMVRASRMSEVRESGVFVGND
jgi:tRNA threonylcarbamoyladenosine biosynthesis protein TsaB